MVVIIKQLNICQVRFLKHFHQLITFPFILDIPTESCLLRPTVHEDPNHEQANSHDEQLQVVANLSDEVKKQEQYALAMERLQEDVQDINSVFHDLSQLVNVSTY